MGQKLSEEGEELMTVPKIALVADSTCDIPEALVEQYGIAVIPTYVIWGEGRGRR